MDNETIGQYGNVNNTALLHELMFERNFDVEMIDPEIYRGIAGVDELSVAFEQPENPDSGRNHTDHNDLPTELDNGIQELQIIEARAQISSIYPSPITSVFDWEQMKQAHEHPGYEDYVPSPDEEDIRCTPRAVTTVSSSSSYTSSTDSDMILDYATPSPPCTPWRRRKSFTSPGTPCSPPLAAKRFDSRELSPSPGTRGHESFLDAASAILDLPLSWGENGTLREFLDEGETGDNEDEDEDDSEDEIDYTTPQVTKMRQPDFLRDDSVFQRFDGLDAHPTRSLVTMSTSDFTKLATTQTFEEESTPIDTENEGASVTEAVTRTSSSTLNIGPFSLTPTEVMSSDD
ncbi:hypothetical protein FQN49_005228 [Arthroderma sp. PD_2]|nr:hypothetical protein FQN49_005228 [Arthroderma sp. PD_2]